MTTLVIDASVWVSAADATDALSESSRAFLSLVVERELPIALPQLAKLEIACALSRRLRDAERGRGLADQMLGSPLVTMYSLNRAMLRQALQVGTRGFLRSGDALYAALAEWLDAEVVSWDGELIDRAGASTPTGWIERNA
ncbi:type II toxin-antitoxin system VapC family toxin [Candidatus Palauibacter sp.]|uniref:type II toxin-antitoxin system VapC family toxin n=1 Tax=Candidatus Palauibacter sp. TaxID=3101350 RepID=UPI003AF30A6F